MVSGVDLFTCMCTQPLWCNTCGDPDEGSCLNWVPVFDSMDGVVNGCCSVHSCVACRRMALSSSVLTL